MQKENKSWISALVSWRIISTNHIIFLGVLAQQLCWLNCVLSQHERLASHAVLDLK
jgi:hypothetical protein